MGWGNESTLVQLKRDAARVRQLEATVDGLRADVAYWTEAANTTASQLHDLEAKVDALTEVHPELADDVRAIREAGPIMHTCGAPIDLLNPFGSPHVDDMAAKLAHYLQVRQHTLTTAHLPFLAKIRGEADYVHGEAQELRDAVYALSDALHVGEPDLSLADRERAHVRHEIADVALANTCLAGFLGVTVEDCIAEKTELDRGRG